MRHYFFVEITDQESAMRVAKIAMATFVGAAIGVGALLGATSAGAVAENAGISGVWTTEHGDARIRVAPCGQALCGAIVWLADPNDSNGRPKTDINNADEAKRARPLKGLTIFTELTPNGEEWRGKVYNSDNGKDYDVAIRPLDARHASVKGCILGGLSCDGETWTRY
jgi:uncharacterized protein (DUF2147 family)